MDRQTVSTADYEKLKRENEELKQWLDELSTSHEMERRYRQDLEDKIILLSKVVIEKEKPLN